MKYALEVTDAAFEQEVIKSEVPVLVDFWAAWCGPCRAVAPTIEKIAEDYQGRVKVLKLNVDENPRTAEAYGIRSIPTIALFAKGEVVDGVLGMAPASFFSEMLDKHLAGTPAVSL
jgi:thioredoxin 1